MKGPPRIEDLTWVDLVARRMSIPIVVAGCGAAAFTLDVHRKCGGQSAPSSDDPKTISYTPLNLPPLRGFATQMHFWGFPTHHGGDEGQYLRRQFWHHLSHTRWLVLSTPGPPQDRSWVEVFEDLSRHLDQTRPDVTLALHGPSEVKTYAEAAGLPEPQCTAADSMAVLKALARHFFMEARRA